MSPAGDVIENPAARMRMRVLRDAAGTGGELLELEATYEPGSLEPLEHFHPRQAERFEVKAGAVRTRVAGDERDLATGEELDIPAGTVHAMWNDGDGPATVIWQTRPALHTEEFLRTVGTLAQEGRLTAKGAANPLLGASLMHTYRGEFRLPKPPAAVQTLVFPPLAGLAKLLGQAALIRPVE